MTYLFWLLYNFRLILFCKFSQKSMKLAKKGDDRDTITQDFECKPLLGHFT